MIAGLEQGAREAAPEAAGLLFTVLLVWLVLRLCQAYDQATARRRRRTIAEARALANAPGWVTPQAVYIRDGQVIGVRWQGRLDDADGEVAALSSMMVRSRGRAGVR